jgi:metallo-beta-lactamase class B
MSIRTPFRFWSYNDASGKRRSHPPPQHIYGPVYYIGPLWVSSYLIDARDGLVVIDTGAEEEINLIERNIRALGFDPTKIKAILITHWHQDHTGETAHLAELSGATVYVHERDAEIVQTGIYRGERIAPRLKAVSKLTDGQVVEVGGIQFKTIHCPGQSAGEVTFAIVVDGPDGPCRIAFTGDSTGFKHDVAELEKLGYPGVCADYRRTVETLKRLEFDLLLSGHPHQVFGEAREDGSPLVTRDEWLRVIKNRHANMENFITKYPHYVNM